jgi:hypothetical protein
MGAGREHEMLKLRRAEDPLKIVMDARDLGIADASFDAVTS